MLRFIFFFQSFLLLLLFLLSHQYALIFSSNVNFNWANVQFNRINIDKISKAISLQSCGNKLWIRANKEEKKSFFQYMKRLSVLWAFWLFCCNIDDLFSIFFSLNWKIVKISLFFSFLVTHSVKYGKTFYIDCPQNATIMISCQSDIVSFNKNL